MYIIVEYIEGENLQQYLKDNPSQLERLDDAVCEAIRSLWGFPIPDDAKPGPLEWGSRLVLCGGTFSLPITGSNPRKI